MVKLEIIIFCNIQIVGKWLENIVLRFNKLFVYSEDTFAVSGVSDVGHRVIFMLFGVFTKTENIFSGIKLSKHHIYLVFVDACFILAEYVSIKSKSLP